MLSRRLRVLALGGLILSVTPCIWDRDTLADELRGLPGAFTLVAGRWFTHGDGYYQRRVAVLPGKLAAAPESLALYDDLAVAHERLGDRALAIAVMEQKAAALDRAEKAGAKDAAEQRYRYHANLGTFLAHSGRLAEAVVELERAVKLNPEAHFGRERFQIDILRYLLAAKADETLWTKHNFLTFGNYQMEKRYWRGMVTEMSFSTRIRRDKDRTAHRWTTHEKAYTGVAGMLRFGGLEGAELYRTLGDLFTSRRDLNLAWWSYRRALERGHPAEARLRKAVASIQKHWVEAKKAVGGDQVPPDLVLYKAVRAESKAWRKAFWKAETAALAKGEDPGERKVLEKLLAAADRSVPPEAIRRSGSSRR